MYLYSTIVHIHTVLRYQDVLRLPMRSVRKDMKTSARKLQRKLERKLLNTDVPGLRDTSLMMPGANVIRDWL